MANYQIEVVPQLLEAGGASKRDLDLDLGHLQLFRKQSSRPAQIMYLCDRVQVLASRFILSRMYDRYTKLSPWRNLAKRSTPPHGSRDAAECADAGCRGATGTQRYGGCAGAAVLGCGRSVPLKTAVESSPWTEREAPKSTLTASGRRHFSPLPGF